MIADENVGLLARCIAESATFVLTKCLGNCDGRFEGRALPRPGAPWYPSVELKPELLGRQPYFRQEEHSVRDRGVGGSNPLAPTNFFRSIPQEGHPENIGDSGFDGQ
jgi:hypothetical protein